MLKKSCFIFSNIVYFSPSKINSHNLAINRLHTFQIYLVDFILQTHYTHLTYTHEIGILKMIQSFADRDTELIYNQEFSKRLPSTIQKVALRKLMMVDNAKSLNDLRIPPNNRLEQLHGDRNGQY